MVEPVETKIYALALEACAVVVDKPCAQERNQCIVAEAALYHALGYVYAAYVAGLAALEDVKLYEASAFVGSVQHGGAGFVHVCKGICLVCLHAAFPAHTGAAQLIRPVKVLEAEYFIQRAAGGYALLPLTLAVLSASLVSSLAALVTCQNGLPYSVL